MILFPRPGFALVLDDPVRPPVLGGLGIGISLGTFVPPTLDERPQPSVAQPGIPIASPVEDPYLDKVPAGVPEVVEFAHPDQVVDQALEVIDDCLPHRRVEWPLEIQSMASLTRKRRNPLDKKGDFHP